MSKAKELVEKYKIDEFIVNKLDLKKTLNDYLKLEKMVADTGDNVKNIVEPGFNIPDKAVKNIIDNIKKAMQAIQNIGKSF